MLSKQRTYRLGYVRRSGNLERGLEWKPWWITSAFLYETGTLRPSAGVAAHFVSSSFTERVI